MRNLKLWALLFALISTSAYAVTRKASYVAQGNTGSPASAATDVCTLTGSASKTLYVTGVKVTTTQTTAGTNLWYLVKRSVADTGGTSTAMTAVPMDSNTVASVGSAVLYTGNPTVGTSTGFVGSLHVFSPAVTTAAPGRVGEWNFGNNSRDEYEQPIALRGTQETLAVNFNGQAVPSGLYVTCNFNWYEE